MKRFFLLFLCVCMTTADAAWHEPVRASHGMVASAERIASQIGVDVMKRGGNAVDAAVQSRLRLRSFIRWRGILAVAGS
jgi:gamma-glutamyltranspeptidase/glutathione hydrolase